MRSWRCQSYQQLRGSTVSPLERAPSYTLAILAAGLPITRKINTVLDSPLLPERARTPEQARGSSACVLQDVQYPIPSRTALSRSVPTVDKYLTEFAFSAPQPMVNITAIVDGWSHRRQHLVGCVLYRLFEDGSMDHVDVGVDANGGTRVEMLGSVRRLAYGPPCTPS